MAASAVEVVMGNYFYTIGDEIRIQEEGGLVEAARLYILQLDHSFLDILSRAWESS